MALNWKDNSDGSRSEAWASRAVGGKYEVRRCEGTNAPNRPSGTFSYQVRHLISTGHGGWNNPSVFSKTSPRTLEEAKFLAQADNDTRLAQAREDVSRWPS